MTQARPSERPWSVRRATPADRAAALELTRRAFRQEALDPKAGALWDWIFLKNPSGARMHYLVADAGERLAGQYAVMPVRMQHEGRGLLGLLSLHTATDPDFERQGIFTTLARELYAQAADEAPIVFGFPNPNSAPGFFSKLDWVEVRPVPQLIRPLGGLRSVVRTWRPRFEGVAAAVDLAAPLLRLAGGAVSALGGDRGAEVQPLDRFEPWVDALWEEIAPGLGTCAIRDAAVLQWRYVDSPFEYRRFALHRGGRPVGLAVTTDGEWRGARLARLMEIMVRPGDAAGARMLLAAVVADAIERGAFAVWAIAGSRHPHRRAMLQSGFLPVPAALAPSAAFGVRHNGRGVVPNHLFHPADWYLSGTDLDYV